jgi:hypothetical protein
MHAHRYKHAHTLARPFSHAAILLLLHIISITSGYDRTGSESVSHMAQRQRDELHELERAKRRAQLEQERQRELLERGRRFKIEQAEAYRRAQADAARRRQQELMAAAPDPHSAESQLVERRESDREFKVVLPSQVFFCVFSRFPPQISRCFLLVHNHHVHNNNKRTQPPPLTTTPTTTTTTISFTPPPPPAQEKLYEVLMMDDALGAGKRIGLGTTFDGRVSLKCSPAAVYLVPNIKRAHKSSVLDKAKEWRLNEVRACDGAWVGGLVGVSACVCVCVGGGGRQRAYVHRSVCRERDI